MLEGQMIFHPTDYGQSLTWDIADGVVGKYIRILSKDKCKIVAQLPLTNGQVEALTGYSVVKEWAYRNGYLLAQPSYPDRRATVAWIVTQQAGTDFQVEYFYNGNKHAARLSIPGADSKLSEDMLRSAIVNELQGAIRKHKYVGLAGKFEEANKNGDDKKDTTEG